MKSLLEKNPWGSPIHNGDSRIRILRKLKLAPGVETSEGSGSNIFEDQLFP